MLTAGPRARLGLLSPGDRPIERGDPFTIAFGIWGALNCRAGFVVEDAAELPDGTRDYVERLVAPYFEAVAEWYGALHVGQVGGELQRIVDRHLGDPFFGVRLNPGHQLHLDEWVNSPVFAGLDASSCARAWRCSATSSPPRARRTSRPTSRTGWRSPTSRCGPSSPRPTPGRGQRIQARRRFMADAARHRPPPRRAAVLEPRRPPAAVPAAPDRAMTVRLMAP